MVHDVESNDREEELEAIIAIYPELQIDPTDRFIATLDIPVQPSSKVKVTFNELDLSLLSLGNGEPRSIDAHYLGYLPPVHIRIKLPEGYPSNHPPLVTLSSRESWIPVKTLKNLEEEAEKLWEEYGHAPAMFAFIDHIQQAAERVFDLCDQEGTIQLPSESKDSMLLFDEKARKSLFDSSTFDCLVCLDPKKGSNCHQMWHCGHVFCVDCLQNFYNSCIAEGDVAKVVCMDPTCGGDTVQERRGKKLRSVSPKELLNIPLDRVAVQRYVNIKRKKKMEADKKLSYCPRKWCQGFSFSKQYPKITSLEDYDDSASEAEHPLIDDGDYRLAKCEDCSFVYCRVCHASWHGEHIRCEPKSLEELTAEEKASSEYIAQNTTPCASCSCPVQKSYGCNHMQCSQCQTHFCYLCSAWLDPRDPYDHFRKDKNRPATNCTGRLFELEEGDNGQGGAFAGARGIELDVARWQAEENPNDELDPQEREQHIAYLERLGEDLVQDIMLGILPGEALQQRRPGMNGNGVQQNPNGRPNQGRAVRLRQERQERRRNR
jgi:E3 ubiquitin-protein ligase RNF14